jgi:site-specific DNA-methyltransferase (adenine-specific)
MLEINKIYLGDCLEIMKLIDEKSVDLILTDLPYEVSGLKWDKIISFDLLWSQYIRILKDDATVVLTSTQPFTTKLISSNLEMFKYNWIWEKNIATGFLHANNMPLRNFEDICVFSKGVINHPNVTEHRMTYNPQGIIRCDKENKRSSLGFEGKMQRGNNSNEYVTKFTNYPRMILNFKNAINTVHPTQKPVELMEYLIKTYTNDSQLVLDSCMGSGSTIIACKNTGRSYIGIEKEQRYFEIANERINKHVGNEQNLFG